MAHMAGGRDVLHGSRALTGQQTLLGAAMNRPTADLSIFNCTPLALHSAPDCTTAAPLRHSPIPTHNCVGCRIHL